MRWWHIRGQVAVFLILYLGEMLVRCAKRGSELVAVAHPRPVPGAVSMLASLTALDWFDGPW